MTKKMQCNIFNIQRFSIHDGPGVRTTVFIKGCPLHCPWCSNPESQPQRIQLTWDSEKCIGCKKCTQVFPDHNVRFKPNATSPFANTMGEVAVLPHVTEERAKAFQAACPHNALAYEGELKTVEQVMREVLKDQVFYEESNGGMTLSGGEALSQPDFSLALLKEAKKNGIHTTIETTCFCDTEKFKEIMQYTDLLYCDIKHGENQKHKEITGVDLTRIDENILYATGCPDLTVIGRIPVIPGFNDTKDDAKKLSERMLRLDIQTIHLLPFHNFGENKYRLLQKNYKYENMPALDRHAESFLSYQQVFIDHGINVSENK